MSQQSPQKSPRLAKLQAASSPREQMLEAKTLIDQKRYTEARSILETVDHPKAREWLTKLDDVELGTEEKPRAPFGIRLFRAFMVILCIVLAAGVIFLMVQRQQSEDRRFQEQRSKANAALSLLCSFSLRLGEIRCDQWTIKTLNGYLEKLVDPYGLHFDAQG